MPKGSEYDNSDCTDHYLASDKVEQRHIVPAMLHSAELKIAGDSSTKTLIFESPFQNGDTRHTYV